jgi:hypothetical protein
MAVKHAFVSAKADDPDTTLVRPSNWNANHAIDAGTIGPTELASTAVTPGTYGDASHVAQVTVDQQGRITAASNVAISITVTESNISLSDVTTDDVSITKHGFAPKAPNDATKFLDGTGAYSVPAGGGGTSLGLVMVMGGGVIFRV